MHRRSRCVRAASLLGGLAVATTVPVVLRAPRPVISRPDGMDTTEDAIQVCQGTGLIGWELVDEAIELVNDKFTRYSCWHLWEGSGRAFRNSRGYSDQFNLALARILSGLGFEVHVLHAARVRSIPAATSGNPPWWNAGRTWLAVTHEGRTLELSAGQPGLRAGELPFVATSEARLVNPWTAVLIRLAMAPFVVATIWRSWLAGEDVPRWLYREF